MGSPKQSESQAPVASLLAPHQVIVRPLVTEKGMHRSTRHNAYAFEVNRLATKHDIRHAVEELFHVRVEGVRTMNRHGKKRRFRMTVGQLQKESP